LRSAFEAAGEVIVELGTSGGGHEHDIAEAVAVVGVGVGAR
jgi:hypothetical protein